LNFQAIDDKKQCIGLYADGRLYYDNFPDGLTGTWKYSSAIETIDAQYASLYCGGLALEQVCPPSLEEELKSVSKKLNAYLKSFKIAKINMREHCIFELVPEDFLKQYCELKNQITDHVLQNYDAPPNYNFLCDVEKLLYKIRYQDLNLNADDCRELYVLTRNRNKAQELLTNYRYIDYNLFGTVTGRLTTRPGSFPILTVRKDFRKLIKPHNDWFLSLDYNGAEIRTFLALSGLEQPTDDIHEWNMRNIYHDSGETSTREEAKVRFFAWLYDDSSEDLSAATYYDKGRLVSDYHNGTHITTPFDRTIKVEKRKALNYLIQSVTSDLVLERAIALDKLLEGRESFISHVVHDEIVIDLAESDKKIVPEIKEMFANNRLACYNVNLNAGKNYLDLKELKL
jgi:hypothetical protein